MKVGNIFILLSVIVVVFLAGCAEQKTVEEGGVSIEKFTPQVSTVASKSPVELTLIVENIGEREAKEVKAVLGGLTFLPSEFSGSAEEAQQYWKLESETLMKYLDTSSVISVAAENSNLLGEDIESGFKGEQGIVTWRLTAPIQARDQTYEPTVNVVYNYSTISTVLVKAVDFNYFQSLPEAEQASVGTGIIVSKITKGPLDITIKSDQAIISGGATLPIEIEFKNVGGGRTFIGGHAEVNATELYKSIKNVGIGAGLDKILVELPSDIQCNLKLTNGRYEVRLIEGKTGRLLCNKVIGKVSTVQTLSMDIKAEYRYLIEGKTSIKVSKTLYKVPIVDISVLDSTLELVADHDFSAYASIQLAVKNVGNQNIEKINIPIKYSVIADSKLVDESDITVYKDTDSPLIPFSTKFYPEDIKLLGLGVLLPSGTKEVKIDISAPQIKIGSLEEKNTANNKMSSSMVVDYDIAVESLKAEVVGKPNPLSTKITAIIKNNAENVKVRSIPTEIKVDNVELDYTKQCSPDNNIELTSGYVRVKELTKRASQEISCIYDNSEGKLEFNIIASISKSISDLKPDNDANDKPNNKPNPFKSTQPAPPPEQVIEPPLVSLGTSIISPADNTWQGTDKITMNVQDTGVTSCSVTVQDETQITANKLTRTCNEDVMINLKSSCSTNENCCSIEGEGKCKVTLFSSDGKQEYTASRTFNIDRKPPTITSLVIKDRLTGSTATAGRGLTLELSIKDESTSLVRNTASGIDTCKFIETYRDLSLPAGSSDVPVKTSNWTSCDTKILKADAYVNSNAFNYWSKLSSPDDFTSKITVHARDKAGNIATTGPGGVLTNAKTIVIKAPTETVSINDVNNGLTGTRKVSGTQEGYCGEIITGTESSCKFNNIVASVNPLISPVGSFGSMLVNFKTDKPAICGIIDTSSALTDATLSTEMSHPQFFDAKCASVDNFKTLDDLKQYDSSPEIACNNTATYNVPFPTREVPQPIKYLYIACKDHFSLTPPCPGDGTYDTDHDHCHRESCTPTPSCPAGYSPQTDGCAIGASRCVASSTCSDTLNIETDKCETIPTKVVQTYRIDVTFKDVYPPLTKLKSVGTTSMDPMPAAPKAVLESSTVAKIVVSGDEAMTCKWYERPTEENYHSYGDAKNKDCAGSGTSTATCNTGTATNNGFFVRGNKYTMCTVCADKVGNEQRLTSEANDPTFTFQKCIEFEVTDFP